MQNSQQLDAVNQYTRQPIRLIKAPTHATAFRTVRQQIQCWQADFKIRKRTHVICCDKTHSKRWHNWIRLSNKSKWTDPQPTRSTKIFGIDDVATVGILIYVITPNNLPIDVEPVRCPTLWIAIANELELPWCLPSELIWLRLILYKNPLYATDIDREYAQRQFGCLEASTTMLTRESGFECTTMSYSLSLTALGIPETLITTLRSGFDLVDVDVQTELILNTVRLRHRDDICIEAALQNIVRCPVCYTTATARAKTHVVCGGSGCHTLCRTCLDGLHLVHGCKACPMCRDTQPFRPYEFNCMEDKPLEKLEMDLDDPSLCLYAVLYQMNTLKNDASLLNAFQWIRSLPLTSTAWLTDPCTIVTVPACTEAVRRYVQTRWAMWNAVRLIEVKIEKPQPELTL